MPRVYLHFVIVIFSDHTNLLFFKCGETFKDELDATLPFVNNTQCYGFHYFLYCACASGECHGETSRMRGSSEISVDACAMSTKVTCMRGSSVQKHDKPKLKFKKPLNCG